jgi:hypothetical protein
MEFSHVLSCAPLSDWLRRNMDSDSEIGRLFKTVAYVLDGGNFDGFFKIKKCRSSIHAASVRLFG